MEYKVKIDAFEGPLDLLLHLINRFEIDIYDIPVAKITDQYLMYIHTMKELQLDVASEYLVMAATLLSIKSKMLVPRQEEQLLEEDELLYEEDPRQELVERLLEYRQYKQVAEELKIKEDEQAEVFVKAPSDLSEYAKDIEQQVNLGDTTIYDMIAAYQKVLRRQRLQKPLETKITRQEIPIEQRMDEIVEQLTKQRGVKSFHEFFPYHHKSLIVVTFLAMLELMKKQLIVVKQEENLSDLQISGSEKLYE
ncbi:segregation/condensation protein A [Bacillus carboniphilus]|uniref:Segregation and condensation protein A n=1 Tax=Bacillus carboniphilus TaxID=86663 RepID=A0ABY9JZ04_9BACI|nr:segregation/condensation protein A [Bacillus carboniphilus]WLR43787.1 segregation/condensation protein A [Bacillus carboniphilus]